MNGGNQMRVDQTVVINRPIEEVFALLADFEKLSQWDTAVDEAEKASQGPMGVGTTVREVFHFLGRRIESTGVVVEYEPNSKFAIKTTSGPLPAELTETLEPVEGGTRVTFTAELELGGVVKLAEPIIARMFRTQVKGSTASLKHFLETQA
jgi:uncharacterized protein YndB with AHSA1/START domain